MIVASDAWTRPRISSGWLYTRSIRFGWRANSIRSALRGWFPASQQARLGAWALDVLGSWMHRYLVWTSPQGALGSISSVIQPSATKWDVTCFVGPWSSKDDSNIKDLLELTTMYQVLRPGMAASYRSELLRNTTKLSQKCIFVWVPY